MTGRIKIIRKTTSVVDGRRQQEEQDFFSCWCDVKSLGTNEKYNALQIGLENTIMFETRACDKMEEIRLNLKEFYAVYKGVEFKISSSMTMLTLQRTSRTERSHPEQVHPTQHQSRAIQRSTLHTGSTRALQELIR